MLLFGPCSRQFANWRISEVSIKALNRAEKSSNPVLSNLHPVLFLGSVLHQLYTKYHQPKVEFDSVSTYFRHCGVTGTVTGWLPFIDLDLLLCVLPLETLFCFFFLLGTSPVPDELSDLFLLFEALVTLLKELSH